MRKSKKINRSEKITISMALILVVFLTLINLQKSQRTQRDLNRLSDVEAIRTALRVYYSKHHRYPNATDDGRILSCGWHGETICEWGEIWEDEKYIYTEKLPIDGLVVKEEDWPPYFYQYLEDGQKYFLIAAMEVEDRAEIADSHQRCPGSWASNQYVECR